MGDQRGNPGAIQATFGNHSTDDGVFVALWDITAGNNYIIHKETRVWAVLAWVGHFLLGQRGLQPLWFHDGDQRVAGGVVGREIDRVRNEMAELSDIGDGSAELDNEGLRTIFLEGCRELGDRLVSFFEARLSTRGVTTCCAAFKRRSLEQMMQTLHCSKSLCSSSRSDMAGCEGSKSERFWWSE